MRIQLAFLQLTGRAASKYLQRCVHVWRSDSLAVYRLFLHDISDTPITNIFVFKSTVKPLPAATLKSADGK